MRECNSCGREWTSKKQPGMLVCPYCGYDNGKGPLPRKPEPEEEPEPTTERSIDADRTIDERLRAGFLQQEDCRR
jgi:uncharacterized Zn finger protein (UPF0148 family)